MKKVWMPSGRTLGAFVLATIIAVAVWVWVGSRSSEEDDATKLPTFASTPTPAEYTSLAELADELEADGIPCEELEAQEVPQRSIEEFATCYLMQDGSKNVELWLFTSEKNRDAWVDAFQVSTLVVVGPNWAATPQDHERANAIMGSLGGQLVGRLPD